MYIKQLILQGFKTYKDLTVVDEFDPALNVILGKNGAGKSNLLDAIQFVISDKYANLRSEERQRLLYEGSGREVMAASVELIFDNSDSRIPTQKESTADVSIKRSIGLKKDEYFVDMKHTSKQDLSNLLESAGMSRTNPYYIVEQGKINALIRMRDSERLELFKEIAGTRTYEERRRESMRIMKDTDHKSIQVVEVIAFLDSRLKELVHEKKELDKYQELDSKRRALEYTIFDVELQRAQDKLSKIEEIRSVTDTSSTKLYNQTNKLHKDRQQYENESHENERKLNVSRAERKNIGSKRKEIGKALEQQKVHVEDLQSQYDDEVSGKSDAEKSLAKLQKEIDKAEASYQKAQQLYDERLNAEREHIKRIDELETRLQQLYSKQGRKQQFKSKKERDNYLKKQIAELKKQIEREEQNIAELQQQRDETEKQVNEMKRDVESKQTEGAEMKADYERESAEYQQLKSKRDDLLDAEKRARQQQHDITRDYEGHNSKVDKAQSDYYRTIDRDTLAGIRSIETLKREGKIQGIHGPLIELFTTESTFFKCIETTAGNSLFHVVVDNETVASKIITYLNEGDPKNPRGRLTFIPLSRLEAFEPEYPKSPDILPMIDKLEFKAQYRRAMIQVFGRTVIARDIKTATEMSNQHDLNGITLHGDRVDKKGAITGGSHSARHTQRLEAYTAWRQARDDHQAAERQRQDLEKQIADLQKEVSGLKSQVDRIVAERNMKIHKIKQLHKEILTLQAQIPQVEKQLNEYNELIGNAEATLSKLRAELHALEEELNSDFTSDLSEDERNELEQIVAQLDELKKSLTELRNSRLEAETERDRYESLLNQNLYKQRERLIAVISGTAVSVADELAAAKDQLTALQSQLKDADAQLKALDKEIAELNTRQSELQGLIDDVKRKEQELHARMTDESKEIEKLISKKSTYAAKRDECQRKIRELGSLPADAFSRYRDKNTRDLIRMVDEVNVKLSKMTGINKKAADQYTSFTEQKKELEERKKELDNGRDAIMKLIQHLDAKKEEAIQRTFKAIAYHFRQVFSEIVPGGVGQLVMQTKAPEPPHDSEEEKVSHDEQEEKKHEVVSGIANYTGVSIDVTFPGGGGAAGALSGGQESVVALSLIFAIQRCDPSPFYIFDEIDSALDPQYRQSVAKMIGQQSENTQFITTTFHPEQLEVASKFYGVTFKAKASMIRTITREEAFQFMSHATDEADRERGAGRTRPSPAVYSGSTTSASHTTASEMSETEETQDED